MSLITLDIETFWSTDYTLSKMTTEAYVRHPDFHLHMVGLKVDDGPVVVLTHEQFIHALGQGLRSKIENGVMLCQNTLFDGFVMAHHYNLIPKFYADSMSMFRMLYPDRRASLAEISKELGLRAKGGESGYSVMQTRGVRHLDPWQWNKCAEYCKDDVQICYDAFQILLKRFPLNELKCINSTIRMFTQPILVLNPEPLKEELDYEISRKAELMEAIGHDAKTLSSSAKFADLLASLGVPAPVKLSPTAAKKDPDLRDLVQDLKSEGVKLTPATCEEHGIPWVYAFSKSDVEFKHLLQHNDPMVVAAVEARLGVKSTISQTRAARFLDASSRGAFPIPLIYWGAAPGRFAGAGGINIQNLTRGSRLRQAIEAPPGHLLAVCDYSGVEARCLAWVAGQEDLQEIFRAGGDIYCTMASSIYGRTVTKADKKARQVGKSAVLGCIAEGELVLTSRGLVPIEKVSLNDRVWDGIEWVEHTGAVFQGVKEVITYDGLTATPDHLVFTLGGEWVSLLEAATKGIRIAQTADKHALLFWAPDAEGYTGYHNPCRVTPDLTPRSMRTYDITNAGRRNRFTVSGKLVHNCGYSMSWGRFQEYVTETSGVRFTAEDMEQLGVDLPRFIGQPRNAKFVRATCPSFITHEEFATHCAVAEFIVSAYRAANYKIVRLWKQAGDALNAIYQGACVQVGEPPGLITTSREGFVLPEGRMIRYNDLTPHRKKNRIQWTRRTREGVGSLHGGLVVENCLGGQSEVLTLCGWKSIKDVSATDLVWDGGQWVSHKGVVYKGIKPVNSFGGVWMTPDHEVLINGEWRENKDTTHGEATSSFQRQNRIEEGYAHCDPLQPRGRGQELVGSPVRLRHGKGAGGFGTQQEKSAFLRVLQAQTIGRQVEDTRDVEASSVRGVAQYAGQVPTTNTPSIQELRRQGDLRLPTLARVLREFLGRYGAKLHAGVMPRQERQQRGVRAGELPMGDVQAECTEHPEQRNNRHPEGADAPCGGRRSLGDTDKHPRIPYRERLAYRKVVRPSRLHKQGVYDIVDCGPNHRFTVRGADLRPFIVHNCIQALCRHIMVDQMLQLEEEGVRVAFTCHDEIVAVAREDEAADVLRRMEEVMSSPPEWASGMILGCEGSTGKSYAEAK